MNFIVPIQKSNSLMSCCAPIIQKSLHQIRVFKCYIIDMSIYLQKNHIHISIKTIVCIIWNIQTCLFSVIAFGWHFEQIPFGHGGWSLQPLLIRHEISSNAKNLPLSAPEVIFRRNEWKDRCFTFCSLR